MAKSSHRRQASKKLTPPSRFYQAVMDTPAIAPAYRHGLKAVAPSDKAKIKCRHPKQLKGSVCVDTALQGLKPNDPRWDYAIGYGHTTNSEQIIWVEVHPAVSGDNLKEVRGKLDWLIEWLRTQAQPMNYDPRRIVWVATGSSSFSANDPKIRALRNQGLEFVGGHLEF